MYRAPVDEISHTLRHVCGFGDAVEAGAYPGLTDDVVDAILTEAGRFASEEIAPLARVGDQQPARLADGMVTTPPGWKELYGRWAEGGWNAVAAPASFGGQELPLALAVALLEMWNSGSMAFGIGPTLTMGAIEALDKHASEQLKRAYLSNLVAGRWMGTMNLTEPQAGSDLSALRTRAERAADGTYRIFGQKIFITYGEHDWTDNIVHLVLARLPDAPAGTRGISLFLVPKFLLNEDGSPGTRNDVFCSSLEHKLGIHASPTCTMVYGDGFAGAPSGAIGWLIGEENKGLACMFTMMNNARLAVGMQGVGVAEAAFQKALAFARERRQGKAPGRAAHEMAPIVHHPDVQRNLVTMQALTQAARAISYACAHAIDMSRASSAEKTFWRHRADLLTPIAKAFSTDVGVDVASLGLQVHGGMGYIEETGAAALLRDARIAPIYEGTNGIQAIDLVTRKLPADEWRHIELYVRELAEMVSAARQALQPDVSPACEIVDDALRDVTDATLFLRDAIENGRTAEALAGASPYLRMLALAAGGAYLAKAALSDRTPSRLSLFRFMAENLVVEVAALKRKVVGGASALEQAGRHLPA